MSKKYKKHSYEDRLKYMRMMEDGYSSKYIQTHYGINHELLQALWLMYQDEGPAALVKKQYIKADGAYKEEVVRDIEENHIPLHEATIKYNVSVSGLYTWRRIVREYGYEALYQQKSIGRPRKDMGRPKKKKPEEMTELELLRYENERLRAENALLKKVKALVEEREARLREIGRKPSKS
jgi:transposase-like protein